MDNDLNTDANKSKGSNWLKNIQWHKTPAKCENFEEAIEDSAKKKKFKYEKYVTSLLGKQFILSPFLFIFHAVILGPYSRTLKN